MSVQTQIDRLNDAKVNLKSWLVGHGITVPTNAILSDMVALLPESVPSTGYKNLVPTSTDTNGAVFNNTGYQNGMRLSSSGSVKAQDSSTVTGFIPCKKSDVLRMTGAVFADYAKNGTDGKNPGNGVGALYSYLAIYDTNKSLLHCVQGNISALSNIGVTVSGRSYPVTFDTDIATFDLSDYAGNMAYIRLSVIGSGANLIVTVNEEVV